MSEEIDDRTLEEAWLDQEENIMRVKRLRYLGYSNEEIKKIKTEEEADKIIERAKKEEVK